MGNSCSSAKKTVAVQPSHGGSMGSPREGGIRRASFVKTNTRASLDLDAAMAMTGRHSNITHSTRQVFHALDLEGRQSVSSAFFIGFLKRNGLDRDDARLTALFAYLDSLIPKSAGDYNLTLEEFDMAISSCSSLIYKCVTGVLRVPDFTSLAQFIDEIYERVEPNVSGENAQYIPQLAQVDPDQFSISFTSVDGQHYSVGKADTQFCIQSCSKPISYLIALNEFGAEYVHSHVGTEPSGHKFNEMVLKDAATAEKPTLQIPHNPMINAGAIMTVSMVQPTLEDRKKRLEYVLDVWRKLSGGRAAPVGYDDDTYKSESATADRNWCLAYMMKEKGAFPPCFNNLSETLELYFQICSILNTNRAMSIMAATLANGGLNPRTSERVFSADHVRSALPLMLTAGMYDYSGQWAYDIGLPAKSGVGGCVFMCIPNVGGISIWSPRLDGIGNSARGVAVAKELCDRLAFHNFEVFSGLSQTKWDITMKRGAIRHKQCEQILFAASQGDVAELFNIHASGITGENFYGGDYDARTPLHLAAAEGHKGVVQFLINKCPDKMKASVLNSLDRWKGTPLDDAVHHGHEDIAEVLRAAGAKPGNRQLKDQEVKDFEPPEDINQDSTHVITAAADGDLDSLVTLSATGVAVAAANNCDYDGRTPLHLAASNGHTRIVKYLLRQARAEMTRAELVRTQDRWGHTAMDDAVRENHRACRALLAASVPGSVENSKHGGDYGPPHGGAKSPHEPAATAAAALLLQGETAEATEKEDESSGEGN
jgi:glutaminase